MCKRRGYRPESLVGGLLRQLSQSVLRARRTCVTPTTPCLKHGLQVATLAKLATVVRPKYGFPSDLPKHVTARRFHVDAGHNRESRGFYDALERRLGRKCDCRSL